MTDVRFPGSSTLLQRLASSARADTHGQTGTGVALAAVEETLGRVRDDVDRSTAQLADVQRSIAEAGSYVGDLRALNSFAAAAFDRGGAYDVQFRHEAVDGYRLDRVLGPNEVFEAVGEFVHSAQPGGLYLSFGVPYLDLGSANDEFAFRIEGTAGQRELTFASGTATADVAAAINYFTETTGVTATTSGTGIVIRSLRPGRSEFVSIAIVDDGNIVRGDGIHELRSQNFTAARSPSFLYTSTEAYNSITDRGRDLGYRISGLDATADLATNSLSIAMRDGSTLKLRLDADLESFGWDVTTPPIEGRLLRLVGKSRLSDAAVVRGAAGDSVGLSPYRHQRAVAEQVRTEGGLTGAGFAGTPDAARVLGLLG